MHLKLLIFMSLKTLTWDMFLFLSVEPHMGVVRQQRGPFQGVRVKNSVKELLLHIRSHKQKASGQAVDDFKVAPNLICFGLGGRGSVC